jgi:hypothetical protein
MEVCLIPESGTPAGYSFIVDRRGCHFVNKVFVVVWVREGVGALEIFMDCGRR